MSRRERARLAAMNLGRGMGRDSQWYVIVAGLVADSLNRRFGLGLTEQEIISAGAGLMVGALRLQTWLNTGDQQ